MNKSQPILIACEESGIVTGEFLNLGFTNVFSCDILETSGNYPHNHIVGDVIPLINGNCQFYTSDGVSHEIQTRFSLIIAFPPCTYLSYVGNRHWNKPGRAELREAASEFFMVFANADCDRIAIENPVGHMGRYYRKQDQIIHPYWFGDNAQKRTCLWLKGLPPLMASDMLPKPEPLYICQGEKIMGKRIHFTEGMSNIKGVKKARSKTFPGIARAMATQWGDIVIGKLNFEEQVSLF